MAQKEEDNLMVCCICGRLFQGYGNNPYPVKKIGKCCNECNDEWVIPARLAEVIKNKDK